RAVFAIMSNASNMVAGDTNNAYEVFVRVTMTNSTRRVSVSSAGVRGNNSSTAAGSTNDGRYVAFQSSASNLAVGDTDARDDIFLRDLRTRTTSRVSLTSALGQSNHTTRAAAIAHAGTCSPPTSFRRGPDRPSRDRSKQVAIGG